MQLSLAQKQTLYHDGFVELPGAVPYELVDAARLAINASLGENGVDPAQLTRFRAQSYCPELQGAPVITNLLTDSSVLSLAESAIGPGQIARPGGGQPPHHRCEQDRDRDVDHYATDAPDQLGTAASGVVPVTRGEHQRPADYEQDGAWQEQS